MEDPDRQISVTLDLHGCRSGSKRQKGKNNTKNFQLIQDLDPDPTGSYFSTLSENNLKLFHIFKIFASKSQIKYIM